MDHKFDAARWKNTVKAIESSDDVSICKHLYEELKSVMVTVLTNAIGKKIPKLSDDLLCLLWLAFGSPEKAESVFKILAKARNDILHDARSEFTSVELDSIHSANQFEHAKGATGVRLHLNGGSSALSDGFMKRAMIQWSISHLCAEILNIEGTFTLSIEVSRDNNGTAKSRFSRDPAWCFGLTIL